MYFINTLIYRRGKEQRNTLIYVPTIINSTCSWLNITLAFWCNLNYKINFILTEDRKLKTIS